MSSKSGIWPRCRRALAWPLALLLAAVIVFEEYAWDELAAAVAWLAKWPPLSALERRIAASSPRVALALFLVPALALLPVKLAALFLIEQGHALLGLAVIVLAKLGGTALVARLFTLTRPALMEVPWFVRLYGGFHRCRAWVFERLHASLPWRWTRIVLFKLRRRLSQPSALSRLVRRAARKWRNKMDAGGRHHGGVRK
ncbi:hypothetical protein BI343_04615 [Chromobacterium amazonense]|uniref:Transmembrane protein n=2 Tax=Chromobacterium amazonense TaxID=1382803 RepID=A0A1S1WY67_9NEIS|nr:hypothetical protein [Chromobacterium amazonense]OHX12008.1 hypothetical protein BI343_04615 [Chromobacterium amazonense]PRP70655.1 hypothetical protein BUE93_10240 [Chromobacterium amazonense]